MNISDYNLSWKGVFSDPESNIDVFMWSIGSNPGHSDIMEFTMEKSECGRNDKTIRLQFKEGHAYFFSVKVCIFQKVVTSTYGCEHLKDLRHFSFKLYTDIRHLLYVLELYISYHFYKGIQQSTFNDYCIIMGLYCGLDSAIERTCFRCFAFGRQKYRHRFSNRCIQIKYCLEWVSWSTFFHQGILFEHWNLFFLRWCYSPSKHRYHKWYLSANFMCVLLFSVLKLISNTGSVCFSNQSDTHNKETENCMNVCSIVATRIESALITFNPQCCSSW